MGIGTPRDINGMSADGLRKYAHPKRKRRNEYNRTASQYTYAGVKQAEDREG